jgi:hypothetical protein
LVAIKDILWDFWMLYLCLRRLLKQSDITHNFSLQP